MRVRVRVRVRVRACACACACACVYVCVSCTLMVDTAGVFWTGLRQIGGAACCYLAVVQLYLRSAF